MRPDNPSGVSYPIGPSAPGGTALPFGTPIGWLTTARTDPPSVGDPTRPTTNLLSSVDPPTPERAGLVQPCLRPATPGLRPGLGGLAPTPSEPSPEGDACLRRLASSAEIAMGSRAPGEIPSDIHRSVPQSPPSRGFSTAHPQVGGWLRAVHRFARSLVGPPGGRQLGGVGPSAKLE